jgi:hypothetical protein
VEKRLRAALFATYNIHELNNLSIETALKLFDLKVSPIASSGIEIIWPNLTKLDLENIERVKTRYLKKGYWACPNILDHALYMNLLTLICSSVTST